MKSVLITGGSGFFGQAMVKHLLTLPDEGIYRICIYSRDEAKQATMRAMLTDPDERLRWFIGDVRDMARLRQAMEGVDTVIHAAALKRIETGFYNPQEMIKTNVDGAVNVIAAATEENRSSRRHAQMRVVALSTDKAFQPISPYGQSKALAESLFLAANNTRGAFGPIFSVVRYGNVWNSTGSLLPSWRAQQQTGAPLRITDPECTRFYMTREQAVDLVIRTTSGMTGGELIIPDLPAYRVGDVLEAFLGEQHDYPIKLVGLPAFEKLHESMDAQRCSSIARRMTVSELKEAIKNA